jgi:acyl-CoA reductase-like NAD-dependent aldehyde dehydrogenase
MRFTRQSQSCTAGSRLFLHRDIFDEFLDALGQKVKALKLGDPLDEASDIGTVINEKQFRKVCGYVEEGLNRREARVVIGGLPPKEGPLSEGYYTIPTIFANVANDWRLAREEIFGPVLVAIPWTDEADAIGMANDSHYGLAAYVWSHDIGRALRAAHAIEAGWVQVNQGLGQTPVLRRLQGKRHRSRVLTRRNARELYAKEERHGQSDAVRRVNWSPLNNGTRLDTDRPSS